MAPVNVLTLGAVPFTLVPRQDLSSTPSATTTLASTVSATSTAAANIPGALANGPSARYLTTTISSLTACMTVMIALLYLVGLSWVVRYAKGGPKVLNKGSGVVLQKWAPFVYVFLVLASLCEVAMASWLLLQWSFNDNYLNQGTRAATSFLLFTACWTVVTAAAYSVLFVHPAWSKHALASVGSQSLWAVVTWVLWIVGAGLLNANAYVVVGKGACAGVVYCGQIRGLFGIAVVQSITMTAGMATLLWLAWVSGREVYALNSRPFSTAVARASQMFARPPVPPQK